MALPQAASGVASRVAVTAAALALLAAGCRTADVDLTLRGSPTGQGRVIRAFREHEPETAARPTEPEASRGTVRQLTIGPEPSAP